MEKIILVYHILQ